ncbi:hypothetical protein L1987_36902 [Smallanthus sonchifolius]|uniref:Uncharacterized protein n=1 Tax=Smallanthus sonchifolius TaxID=185202 RepID=A0ACB9HEF4_9ASTR|nr:hypothetical protein L1987_36902 [Smallanthus sonchifolius]
MLATSATFNRWQRWQWSKGVSGDGGGSNGRIKTSISKTHHHLTNPHPPPPQNPTLLRRRQWGKLETFSGENFPSGIGS